MKQESTFRFITTHNLSAQHNMAIDKTLIHSFNNVQEPIFRLYTWEHSFTVGVSQTCDDYNRLYPEYNGNCAKRMTGGGVLFHGHDLSYSLLLPKSFSQGKTVKETYEKICSFLLTFYRSLGLEANYAKDIDTISLSKSNFCQVGFEAYDIIVNGLKIGGNAQKWSKHSIFQHGSIPIKAVEKNEELGNSLLNIGIELTYDDAIERLSKAFETTFNVQLMPSTLNEEEKKKVEELL